MELSSLPKLKGTNKSGRRVGRGRRSGKGKTSGHGVKGQSVRNRLKLRRLQQFKRFPFMRGKSTRRVDWSVRPIEITFARCNRLSQSHITPEVLVDANIIASIDVPVKILGNGHPEKDMKFSNQFLFTRSAEEKIKKAGGTIE